MGQSLRPAEFVTSEVLRAGHQALRAVGLRHSLDGSEVFSIQNTEKYY